MTYQSVLSNVFPHRFLVPHVLAKNMITQLLNFNPQLYPNGSSFAVTVDVYIRNVNLHWWLWLSDASLRYLEKLDQFDSYFANPLSAWHRPKIDEYD